MAADRVHGGAGAGEIEFQHPYARTARIGGDELPVADGVAGSAGEVVGGAGAFEKFSDYVAGGID